MGARHTNEVTTPTADPAGWYRRRRVDVLLALAVLALVAPIVQPLMDQQQSRYYLTAALVDHGTVSLDAYAGRLGVDRAEVDGRLYSDKAPGQSVLAVPAYALYRLAGGEAAETASKLGNLGLWWVSLWVVAAPLAGTAVAMRRLVARAGLAHGTAAALALIVATMLLPFGTQLFSHVLTAFLALLAYLLALDGGRWRLLASGAVAGVAVATEYSAALFVVALIAAAAWRHRGEAVWLLPGGAPIALLLAAYHWAVFASPLAVPYRFSLLGAEGGALGGAGLPQLAGLAAVLGGERGLLVLTPLVAVGVVGCVGALRSRDHAAAPHAVFALAVLVAFVGLQAGWGNPTGGWSPGPRYVVPALPFLAVGVAWAWTRWRPVAIAATVVGVAFMGLATVTLPLAPSRETAAVAWWTERLLAGNLAETVPGAAGGGAWSTALLVLGPALSALLVWRLYAGGSPPVARESRP